MPGLTLSVLALICLTSSIECTRTPKNNWYLGEETLHSLSHASSHKCVKRRANSLCPDPLMNFLLLTPDDPITPQLMDITSDEWLLQSNWNPDLETIILYHGYAGGPNTLPMAIVKDAYLRSGRFNVIMVDWKALSLPPCYMNAVHNMDIVGKCTAMVVEQMYRLTNETHLISCSGHSLGAHVCNFVAKYLPFLMYRIIGLDSAKPYVGRHPSQHLDSSDAQSVQMIITNGGGYGLPGGFGHLDICVNGGKMQPYCQRESNEGLCSHVWAACYLAESLFAPKIAVPCVRKCPNGNRAMMLEGEPIMIGNAAPATITGTYCVYDNHPPFCPIKDDDIGDLRCCMRRRHAHSLDAQNKTIDT